MSDQFGISDQAVIGLSDSLAQAGAGSLVDAFPAALLAPTWRALLENGAIEAPTRVDLDRVDVRVVGPKALELRVPVRSEDGEFVKSVPVSVEAWTASGELEKQLTEEATSLADALELAASLPTFGHHPGQGQKPHN